MGDVRLVGKLGKDKKLVCGDVTRARYFSRLAVLSDIGASPVRMTNFRPQDEYRTCVRATNRNQIPNLTLQCGLFGPLETRESTQVQPKIISYTYAVILHYKPNNEKYENTESARV